MRYNIKLAKLLSKCLFAFGIYFFSSCTPYKTVDNKYRYFQSGLDSMGSVVIKERTIQENDLLNIQIFSKSLNQEQVVLFNIPNTSTAVNSQGYLVAADGYIEVPVIGRVQAAGFTKQALEMSLIGKLSSYIKDPSVIIKFLQFKVSVLGEVKTPGLHSFETDRVTIIDALSASGDLTDYGKRNDILVVREDSTVRKYYHVDLTSGTLFQSPVYQLHPNDIVYVNSSDKKLDEVNKPTRDSYRGWQFALSIISVASAVLFVTYNISKN